MNPPNLAILAVAAGMLAAATCTAQSNARYDAGSGVLSVPGLKVAAGAACYDATFAMRTATPNITVALSSATPAACPGMAAAIYQDAMLALRNVEVSTGKTCFDLNFSVYSQGAETLLDLTGAAEHACGAISAAAGYPIVDTGQSKYYGNAPGEISAPLAGQAFHGQDAQFQGATPTYRDNGDGTVTDLNTGLMWVQARGSKMTWDAAFTGATAARVGGYGDWRVPTIKELYSLIDFTGKSGTTAASCIPYLDARYFGWAAGDTSLGERVIDGQDWSATPYVGTTMNGDATIFGVNFVDGRIKGYPRYQPGAGGIGQTMYVRYVRGNPAYGVNNFIVNGDGTITDWASGLMWSQDDSGTGMNWQEALAWVQTKNAGNHLGYSDWRLPNAKELHSIVDYSRAPQATDATKRGPAIDPRFRTSSITDEGGGANYPFYWTGTTHLDNNGAVYLAFGLALGWMQTPGSTSYQLLDVHGAGAQRSDPKSGSAASYPHGFGPQGDVIRINNYVRLVRGGNSR